MNNGIDSQSLYKEIALDITEKIKSMVYPSGTLLPTEKQLMETYGVSRDTVRKSLALLNANGFVETRQGLGCMVKKPSLSNFRLKFDLSGYREASRKISIEYCTYARVLQALNIQHGKPVIKIERILYEDTKPVIFDMKYIPFKKGTPFIEEEIQYSEFSDLGLIGVSPFTLQCEMDISISTIKQDYLSRILCSKLGEPILLIRRIISDENGLAYAYQSTIMRKGLQMMHATAGYKLDDE